MKLEKRSKSFLQFAGLYLLPVLINILCKSLKFEIKNKDEIENLRSQNKNYVLAFWHGTMLIPWYMHRNQNVGALVSKSKDGDLLTAVLKKWNYNVVRGSSHSGGKEALNILLDFAKAGHPVLITPDGPTGPARKMKAGAVVTAKKSDLPLFLVGVGIEKKHILNSWDSFQIPKLFSKVCVIYSGPVYIDNSLTYDETNNIISELEIKLEKLQSEAEKVC